MEINSITDEEDEDIDGICYDLWDNKQRTDEYGIIRMSQSC